MADNKRGRKALSKADREILSGGGITLKGGPGRTASKATLDTRAMVADKAPTVKGEVVAFVPKGGSITTTYTVVKVPGSVSALRDSLKSFLEKNKGYRTIPANGATLLVKN